MTPKKNKTTKILIIFGLVSILIIGFIIKTREENKQDCMYVAHITDSLIGSDGKPMLTGKECVNLTKYFRHFAASNLHFTFDDIKTIMKIYKDAGGMNDIRTSSEYQYRLENLLNTIDDLKMVFTDKNYIFLTKEIAFFQRQGYSLPKSKSVILKIHYSALQAGMSYEELKYEIYKN